MEENFVKGTGINVGQNFCSILTYLERNESIRFGKDLENAFYLYNGCEFKKPLVAKTVAKEYEFKALLPFDSMHPGPDMIMTINQEVKAYISGCGYVIARDEKRNLLFYHFLAEGMEKMFVYDQKDSKVYQVINCLECLKVFERPTYSLAQVDRMMGTIYSSKGCVNALRPYDLFHVPNVNRIIIEPGYNHVSLEPERFLHFLNSPVDAERFAFNWWLNQYR